MSYCRWSSDDFKSDLYIYANVSGAWTIHVASNRIVGACPAVRWPTDVKDEAQVATWVADNRARSAFLDAADHVEIGLPYDGKTFDLASPEDCAVKCEELRALGYQFPDGVIEALREDQAEIDAEDAAPEPAENSAHSPSEASAGKEALDEPLHPAKPNPQCKSEGAP